MLIDVGAIGLLASGFGMLLGYSAIRFHIEGDPIADQVDALLPQSQCGQCGFPGCRPYAEAVAVGDTEINLCSPGGEATMFAIADLLGREPVAVGDVVEKPKSIAIIDEVNCIGCTKCLQSCPVDAIVGAAKQLHAVLGAECTGCELCLETCPVACIYMEPIPETIGNWKWPYPRLPRLASGQPGRHRTAEEIEAAEQAEAEHREAA